MFKEFLLKSLSGNRGKITGSAIGLLIAILFLTLGFFRTLLIVICVSLGYYIGKQVDDRVDIAEILSRMIPPRWKE